MRTLPTALWLLTLVVTSYSSSGDRAGDFQQCILDCSVNICSPSPPSLPFFLRLTRWTCKDNCKYNCMHDITDSYLRNGWEMHQYYGKWPFWRLFGMQEPASVVFSLMNGWYHLKGWRLLKNNVPETHPMRGYYTTWAILSINAWIWSAVFHTRDMPTTERLDYFAAASSILYALYYTVIRMFHLYAPAAADRERMRSLWCFTCIIVFLAHISYLSLLPRFDYTYNIVFNLALGLTHNIIWILYALPGSLSLLQRFPLQPKSYRPAYANRAALLILLTMCATSLELFDFAPWNRIIDAHSLWHLATVPLIPWWYDFLVRDSRDEGWRGVRGSCLELDGELPT